MIFKFGILFLVSYVCAVDLDDCECGRSLTPVCGSDGETYDNECFLKCAQASNSSITLAHRGKCGPAARPCVCTLEYKPVCGSDGVTYPNRCALGCEPSVQFKHTGSCATDQVKVAELPSLSACTCTRNLKPVCGSDGVTYNNICLLECAAQGKPVTMKSAGACGETNTVKVEGVQPTSAN